MNLQYLQNLQLQNMMGGAQGNAQPLPIPEAPMAPNPSPEYQHPLDAGISAGMQAARQSQAMEDEERRHALASSMGIFFSGLANPNYRGSGFSGSLAALSSSFNPALQNYLAHRQESRNRRREDQRYWAKEQREIQREAREDRRLNARMGIENAQIARQNKMEDRLRLNQEREAIINLLKTKHDIFQGRSDAAVKAARTVYSGLNKHAAAQKGLADYDAATRPLLQSIDDAISKLSQPYGDLMSQSSPVNPSIPDKRILSPEERSAMIKDLKKGSRR